MKYDESILSENKKKFVREVVEKLSDPNNNSPLKMELISQLGEERFNDLIKQIKTEVDSNEFYFETLMKKFEKAKKEAKEEKEKEAKEKAKETKEEPVKEKVVESDTSSNNESTKEKENSTKDNNKDREVINDTTNKNRISYAMLDMIGIVCKVGCMIL